MSEIQLGDKVRDKYTGYEGIAVGKTEFINGCIQFLIAAKWDKKSLVAPLEEQSIDKDALVIIAKKKPEKKTVNGGPTRRAFPRRAY